MTDLQDAILDRLVGTRVGVNWPDGPLAIAAAVVGGTKPVKFGLTDNDRGAKSEIARRLGYPVLLIEAIQGANRAFPDEDDRRGFAMAIFRAIAVGGKLPRLAVLSQNRIAVQMAIRVHADVCSAQCPVPRALEGLLADESVAREVMEAAYRARCSIAHGVVGRASRWLTARTDRNTRLLHAATHAINGFWDGQSMGGWCSIRESARLAASERGMEEAVSVCVEIARQCGLAVGG